MTFGLRQQHLLEQRANEAAAAVFHAVAVHGDLYTAETFREHIELKCTVNVLCDDGGMASSLHEVRLLPTAQ